MGVRLTVLEGPHQGQEFAFTEHDVFLVGRSRSAHFRLPDKDPYFSRLHFLVEVNPPHSRLTDLGSHNGTYVNGKKVGVADLKDGDLIQGGTTVLRLSVEAPGEMPATARYRALSLPPQPPSQPGIAKARLRKKPSLSEGRCLACGAAAEAGPLCPTCRHRADQKLQPIPGYLLVKELGRGGMGVVSLALRVRDDLPVALKSVIPAAAGSRDNVERFLREARILQHLDHPHIVSFLEMGEADSQLFFAMEYVPGTDAAHLLKEHGPLPVARAVALTCQLLEALEYAHEQGFVHRDIKPHNLLVRADSEVPGQDIAKLTDFGLARVYQSSPLSGLTAAGGIGGPAAFMAPEQITAFRKSKSATDQYSAGATLYNLLTGCYVYDFPSRVTEQLMMILLEDPVPILQRCTDLPAGLAEIIHRSLARDPKNRFRDVWTMRAALLEFA
jgi:eukaryotic-like serine/threonine-protein kinase